MGQAVASATTLCSLAAAGHALEGSQLGVFALVFSTLLILLSLSRAFTGEALLLTGDNEFSQGNAAVGLAAVVGSIVALACLATAAFPLGSSIRGSLLAVAALAPTLLAYDATRYVFIKQNALGKLILADVAMGVGQVSGVYLAAVNTREAAAAILGWAAASAMLTTGILLLAALRPALWQAWPWLLHTFHRSSAFAAEALLGAAVGYATLVALAAWSDTLAVASFRSALTVFGFTSVLAGFMRSVVLADLVSRRDSMTPRQLDRAGVGMAAALFIALGAAFTFLELLPTDVGEALFGSLWPLIAAVLLPAAVNRFASLLSVVPAVLLRAQGATWEVTRRRIFVACGGFALGPVGGAVWGASGALYMEAITYALTALLLWQLSRRIARRAETSRNQLEAAGAV
ncbi:MATE family efflux transporter [Blastococcus atacamensis]|uniref:hypothetical protein n=1 Tax=Blastococcus atacamensis TaxID=2070508 RepID=UPI0012FFF860|nr:hypothetical protein [Blastococcus atacamensis]